MYNLLINILSCFFVPARTAASLEWNSLIHLLFVIPKRIATLLSQLTQFSKHSDSADLLRKSLLPHVWAGLKCSCFFVPTRTAASLEWNSLIHLLFVIPKRIATLLSQLTQFSKHSDSADLLRKSLLPHVWAGLKCSCFFVPARTAASLETLGYHIRSGHLMPRRSVHVSRIFFVNVIRAI